MKRSISLFAGNGSLDILLAIAREISAETIPQTWKSVLFLAIIAAMVIIALVRRKREE